MNVAAPEGDLRVERPSAGALVGMYALFGAAAVALGLWAWPPSLTDWDSWEYAGLAVQGQPSGLCLGRWWFIFLMRVSWLVGKGFGVELAYSFVPMKIAVLAMSAGSVVAVSHLTLRITGRWKSAVVAGAMALVSPAMLAYCSTVMTEGPTVFLLVLALLGWEAARRSASTQLVLASVWALLAGWLFGMAVSMREPALLLGAWPFVSAFVDKPRGRWLLLLLAVVGMVASVGFAVGMAWVWSGKHPVQVMADYSDYMKLERETYGFLPGKNILYLIVHLLLASPLAWLTLALASGRTLLRPVWTLRHDESRRPIVRREIWMLISAIPYVLMTWYNPNLSFNYRLLLPLAWFLIPLCADWAVSGLSSIGQRAGLQPAQRRIAGAIVVGLLAVILLHEGDRRLLRNVRDYHAKQHILFDAMRQIPGDVPTVVVPGPGSAIGIYLVKADIKPQMHVITTAVAEFPWQETAWLRGELAEQLADGKRVFVDTDPYGWTRPDCDPFEWRTLKYAAEGFIHRPFVGPIVEFVPPSAP